MHEICKSKWNTNMQYEFSVGPLDIYAVRQLSAIKRKILIIVTNATSEYILKYKISIFIQWIKTHHTVNWGAQVSRGPLILAPRYPLICPRVHLSGYGNGNSTFKITYEDIRGLCMHHILSYNISFSTWIDGIPDKWPWTLLSKTEN